MLIRPKRSDEPGKRPLSDIRVEGEIYLNRADRQFGYHDAQGNPVDLLAVRLFQTGADYKANDVVVYDGKVYRALVDVKAPSSFNPNRWRNITEAIPNQPTIPAIKAGNIGQALVVDRNGNPAWGEPFDNMAQVIFGGTF